MTLQQKYGSGPNGELINPRWDDQFAEFVLPSGYTEIDAEEYERRTAEREEALAADLAASRAAEVDEARKKARTVYDGLKSASPEAALVMARQVLPDFDPEEV